MVDSYWKSELYRGLEILLLDLYLNVIKMGIKLIFTPSQIGEISINKKINIYK